MSVAELEPAAEYVEPAPITVEQAIYAGRYVARCRRAGDPRSVLLLLGDILSPSDACRFAVRMERQLGAGRMALLARVPRRQ